jgi:predicted aspartyl protease
MGLTYVDVELYNPRGEGTVRRSFLVDSGAVYSVAPQTLLHSLAVAPLRTERFTLANGEQTEREIGELGFSFEGRRATSPVVFGEGEDVYLLGAVTLETLGYVLDPFRRELRPLRMMLA